MGTLQERLNLVRSAMTQSELAAQMEVPTNTVGRYERGEFRPDLLFLQKLCTKFDVSLDWLVLGIGEKKLSAKSKDSAAATCSNCLELIARLNIVNDRLYHATERERELLKEISTLKQDFLFLKNETLARAGNKKFTVE